MDNIQFNPFEQNLETPFPDLPSNFEWEEKPLHQETAVSAMDHGINFQFLADSMVCDSGSRLIPSGFTRSSCTGSKKSLISSIFLIVCKMGSSYM